MKIFTVFNENIKKTVLYAPLNHPNINYEWAEKSMQINGKESEIIFIGNILDDPNIDIVKLDDYPIGFFDNNHNFVTPILFHPINVKKEEYSILLDQIKDLKNLKKVFNPEKTPSNDIVKFIEDLDNDVPLYMDIIAYIRNGKFDFVKYPNYSKDLINNFISLLKDRKNEIEDEFPHLKLMVNIIDS